MLAGALTRQTKRCTQDSPLTTHDSPLTTTGNLRDCSLSALVSLVLVRELLESSSLSALVRTVPRNCKSDYSLRRPVKAKGKQFQYAPSHIQPVCLCSSWPTFMFSSVAAQGAAFATRAMFSIMRPPALGPA